MRGKVIMSPDYWPTTDWKTCPPEAQGVDPSLGDKIDAYARLPKAKGLYSVLVIRNGYIVCERYFAGRGPGDGHQIKSVIKSIFSTLTGIAIKEGLIESLDAPIHRYLPQYEQFQKRPELKRITIRSVLTMSSGLYWQLGVHAHQPLVTQIVNSPDWTGAVLNLPLQAAPGTNWSYKEADSMLISAVLSGATGRSAYEFARQYLLAPLGMQSPLWPADPQGNSHNYEWISPGIPLTARSMAKLGYLFLHEGQWDGKEILSAEYVREGHKLYFVTNWGGARYGLMWWVEDDYYAARGWGGQTITVNPKKQMVVVTQAESDTRKSKEYDLIDEVIFSGEFKS